MTKTKNNSKVLAILLVLCMVLAIGIVGIGEFKASAASVVEVSNAEELKAALETGGKVKLLDNITLTEGVTVHAGKTVTLDLNGKTVSMSVAAAAESALITNNGTLTINDSGENGKLTYVSSTVSTSYSTSTIINKGTLTVESGIIENTSARGGAPYAIDSSNTLTVNGGTITATNTTAIRQVQSGGNDNTVTVTNGTISGGYAGLQVYVFSNAKKTTTKIDGGTFKGVYAFYTTFYNVTDSSNTKIEVSGGTFDGFDGYDDYDGYVYLCNENKGSTNLNVSITGGTFNGAIYVFTTDASGNEVNVKAITGGTFYYDESEYVADGYEIGADGTVVPDTTIDTEAELVAAIANGGEVVLGGNIELTAPITVTGTVTLDLAGYKISQTKAQTAAYQMILNDGNLTIKDSVGGGKISYTDSGNGGEYVSNTITNRGKLTLKSGTVENLSSATVAKNGYPYAIDTSIWGAASEVNTIIEGGTVTCENYSALRLAAASETKAVNVTITGGTVNGRIEVQNPTSNKATVGKLTISDDAVVNQYNSSKAILIFGGGGTAENLKAEITGGTITGVIGYSTSFPIRGFDEEIISGGTFTTDVSDFCADGYVVKDNGNDTYGVAADPAYGKVAMIDGTYYNTLQDAAKAAGDGVTIEILIDVEVSVEEVKLYYADGTPVGETVKSGESIYVHDFEDATCTDPMTCKNCYTTVGEALDHDWIDATEEAPKTCARCGETEGYPLCNHMCHATGIRGIVWKIFQVIYRMFNIKTVCACGLPH